jgi:hypothetical protein
MGTEEAGAGARNRILAIAAGQIGTTEATGNNDGPVDKYLASVGLEGTGAPYCAAFNRWVYDAANLRTAGPRSALAAAWVQTPTWTAARGGRTPLPGDPWGIYFPSKGRVAHTGLVMEWGISTVRTVEANTSPEAAPGSAADRNGDGVWSKRRLKRQIYSVRSWLP